MTGILEASFLMRSTTKPRLTFLDADRRRFTTHKWQLEAVESHGEVFYYAVAERNGARRQLNEDTVARLNDGKTRVLAHIDAS